MAAPQSPDSMFTVLLVCTGNICRSALAERLARNYLDSALGPEGQSIHLISAGTRAVVGSAMHPHSALVLEGLGGDPAGFVARQLLEEHAATADLTLCLTRSHRREVLRLAPRALSRTYTLREAADLVRLVGEEVDPPGSCLPERARALVKELAEARPRRMGQRDDDVVDPIGQPLDVHQRVGDLIADSLLVILDRLCSLSDVTSEDRRQASGSRRPM